MKNKLVLAAAAVLATVATSSADAGRSLQGPQLTGIALRSLEPSRRVVVTGTILPLAETVGAHRPTSN